MSPYSELVDPARPFKQGEERGGVVKREEEGCDRRQVGTA